MHKHGFVAAERRQQTVSADAAVRKQTQAALPILRDGTFRKRLSRKKVRNAVRHERLHQSPLRDQYRLSGEAVRQRVSGIENTLAAHTFLTDRQRTHPVMRLRQTACGQCGADAQNRIGCTRRAQQERNIHIEIQRSGRAKKCFGREQHGQSEHQPRKHEINGKKNEQSAQIAAQISVAVRDQAQHGADRRAKQQGKYNGHGRQQQRQRICAAEKARKQNTQPVQRCATKQVGTQQQKISYKCIDKQQRIRIDRDRHRQFPQTFCGQYSANSPDYFVTAWCRLVRLCLKNGRFHKYLLT